MYLLLFVLLGVIFLIGDEEKMLPNDEGLSIEVPDGVDVYIGDNHLGQGSVFVTWNKIISPKSKIPTSRWLTSDTSEREILDFVSGQGSTKVWRNATSTEHDGSFDIKIDRIISRRSGGQLDQVCVMTLTLGDGEGGTIHIVVPIRLRSDSHYFTDEPIVESVNRESKSGQTITDTTISFQDVAPPEEYQDEIEKYGFWIPSL